MARTARTFSRLKEAEDIIARLVDKYPDLLWAVLPSQVSVWCIDNQERGEKAIAKNPFHCALRTLKGSEKALLIDNDINVRYIIELYASDWHEWKSSAQQWVLLSKLMEINAEDEKSNRPDCVGFRVLLDIVGVQWDTDSIQDLPNPLNDDLTFDLSLRPGIEEEKEKEQQEVV